MVKHLPAIAEDTRDTCLIPGVGNGTPVQYSYLENSMRRGAWQALRSMGLQRGGQD